MVGFFRRSGARSALSGARAIFPVQTARPFTLRVVPAYRGWLPIASIRAAILEAAPGATEIGDRRAAIRAAAAQMVEGDVLVVAGKGHEQGQLVAGVNHPFDDVTETLVALEMTHV